MKTTILLGIITAILVVIAYEVAPPAQVPTLGNGDASLIANYATSSAIVVGTTASTVLATSTCQARIITVPGTSAIMMTFNDKYTPTGSFGITQAASTTVAYNSGIYGCGALKIFSFAAQNITVTDSR